MNGASSDTPIRNHNDRADAINHYCSAQLVRSYAEPQHSHWVSKLSSMIDEPLMGHTLESLNHIKHGVGIRHVLANRSKFSPASLLPGSYLSSLPGPA